MTEQGFDLDRPTIKQRRHSQTLYSPETGEYTTIDEYDPSQRPDGFIETDMKPTELEDTGMTWVSRWRAWRKK